MADTSEILGTLSDLVGAVAVVVTLIYLAIQVRHSARLLEIGIESSRENARLARAAAIDRHSDAVSRWRGRLIEHEDLARIWDGAVHGERADGVDRSRLENLVIDWVNTYRSNFYRARAVGDEGLARQAVMTVAPLISRSPVIRELWDWGRPMNEISAAAFVDEVEREIRQHGV